MFLPVVSNKHWTSNLSPIWNILPLFRPFSRQWVNGMQLIKEYIMLLLMFLICGVTIRWGWITHLTAGVLSLPKNRMPFALMRDCRTTTMKQTPKTDWSRFCLELLKKKRRKFQKLHMNQNESLNLADAAFFPPFVAPCSICSSHSILFIYLFSRRNKPSLWLNKAANEISLMNACY